mmetsp:Transcript_11333/g.10845  ORF Transcript_11333/g.10845 Transcript_11333/m.10845 type:complete len:225 (-) Transcript_11333:510-1184(-)
MTISSSYKGTSPPSTPMPSHPRPSASPPPNRCRLNSKDIPRTYSGLYGSGGELNQETSASDLLPFELSRNCNTEWIDAVAPLSLFLVYVFLIVACEMTLLIFLPLPTSLTVTNILHMILTMTYFHWIKGSPNFYDQGEMNAMTLWEQLESSQTPRTTPKAVLFIVPTTLCHLACHFGQYGKFSCLINFTIWLICIVAKLQFMNGVRILGINNTIGIDDDKRKKN